MASRRQSLDSQISAAQGQFHPSEDEAAYHDEKPKRRRKKKKRKRGGRNRIQPVLKPISNAMASAAYGGSRAARRSRRGSDNSTRSRASAHGIELAMEKNSMEAVSITSYSHQNSLDAATLPEPPKHLKTNFAIFTASTYMGEMQSKLQNIESTDKSEVDKSEIEENAAPKRRERSGTVTLDRSVINSVANKHNSAVRKESEKLKNGKVRQDSNGRINRQGSVNSSLRGRSREVNLEMAETFYSEKSKVSSASSRTSRAREGSAGSRVRQGSAGSRVGSAGMRQGSAGSRVGPIVGRQGSAGSSIRQGSGRSNRTLSAKSDKSFSMQLPGGTTVVQIDNDMDEISLT